MTIASSPAFPLRWNTTFDRSGAVAVVAVGGELDRLTAPLLHDHLSWLAAAHRGAVELDLTAIAFIDVGGHAVLGQVGRRYQDRGVPIFVGDSSAPVQRLLDLLGWPIPRAVPPRARPHRARCDRRRGA